MTTLRGVEPDAEARVLDSPVLMLCAPLSHVSVSSNDARRRLAARVRPRPTATALVRLERVADVELVAHLVGERAAELLGVDARRELRRAARAADPQLVDQVRAERRPQRAGDLVADPSLLAQVREARPQRLIGVRRVRRRQDVVAIRRERQAMLVREVVVDAHGRELVVLTRAACWNRKRSVLSEPAISSNTPTSPVAVELRMSCSSCAMIGSGVLTNPCDAASCEHVHAVRVAGVAEEALLRVRQQQRRRRRDRRRLVEVLVVDEEERLAAAVVEAGQDDGPADAAAALVQRQSARAAARARGSSRCSS